MEKYMTDVLNDQEELVQKIHRLENDNKKFKQILTQTEINLQHIIDTQHQSVFTKDTRGRYQACNQAFLNLTGMTRDAVIGKSDDELFNEKLAVFFKHNDGHVIKSAKTAIFDQWLTLPDRSHRYLHQRSAPIFGDNDQIFGIHTIVTDKTIINEPEKNSDKNERLLEFSFAEAIDGLFYMMMDEPLQWDDTVDKEKKLDYALHHQRVTKVNKSMLKQYGAREKDFIGRTFYDFFEHNPEDGRKICRELLDNGYSDAFSIERRMDGSNIYIKGFYNCLYDASGRIIGHFGIQRDMTEQVNADNKVEASEKYYKALYNAVTDAILVYNIGPDGTMGNFIEINDIACSLLEYKRQELLSLTPYNIITKASKASLKTVVGKLSKKENVLFEQQYVTKNGKILDVEIHTQGFELNGKDVVISVVRPIGERKKVENALRDSEARFRYFVEQTNEGFYRNDVEKPIDTSLPLDEQVRMVYEHMYLAECNENMARMYGFEDPSEIIGKKIKTFHGGNEVPENVESTKNLILNGYKLINSETVEIDKNGDIVYFLNNAVGIIEKGKLISIWGTQRNITEQRKAEQAVKESEVRFRTLYQNAGDAILIMQKDKFIDCNRKTVEIFGGTREQILKMSPELLSPETQPDGRNSREKASEKINAVLSGEPQFFEWKHRRVDGTLFDAEVSLNLVHLNTGVYTQAIVRDITERKKTEQALHAAEQKLRDIIEYSTNLFYSHTPDHVLTYVSPQSQHFLGCAPNEAKVRWTEFATDNPVNEDGFNRTQKAIETGEVQPPFELELKTKNGKKLWVMVNEAPIVKNGKTVSIVGALTDITAHKNIEHEMNRTMELDSLRAEIWKQALTTFDIETMIQHLLDTTGPVLGVENISYMPFQDNRKRIFVKMQWRADGKDIGLGEQVPSWIFKRFKGKSYITFKSGELPEFAKKVVNPFLKKYNTKSTLVIPFGNPDQPDGFLTAQSYTFTKHFIKQEINLFIELSKIIHIRSQQLQSQAALKESEEKYRYLIQHSGDAIYLLYNRRFEIINEKFVELFGVTLDDANKPDFDFIRLVAPQSRSKVEERIQRQAAGEPLEPNYEFTAINAHGQDIEVEAAVTHIPYKDGVAAQGIIRDVTERKRLEEQLRQSQKMEAIGQLAGGVAHDFNNLLTVINGYSELLLTRNLADKEHKSVMQIHKAGKRAASLTNQLLGFSRKQVIQPRIINLNEIITDHSKMLSRLLGSNIEIISLLDPDLKPVEIDPGQLEQIIMNIAINARDAMPDGGTLTIKTANAIFDHQAPSERNDELARSYSLMEIQDTGVGMDENTRNHIFEPFFTTKETGKGTGLGLATVYGIIKQNEGLIRVTSEPDKGTSFKIYLPGAFVDNNHKNIHKKDKTNLYGNETILLVEDNKLVENVTQATLEMYGYHVIAAANGEEALRVYKDNRSKINLLLTDVVMPIMNGKDLAKVLLKLNPKLKIIFISGYADNANIQSTLDASSSFIQKPYSHEDLAKEIRKLLDD
ncbi:MAG: PAS domain S-box protein [Caldithrix sp.]|nr:PAS domain S-box protein [Caldithrix sp.]